MLLCLWPYRRFLANLTSLCFPGLGPSLTQVHGVYLQPYLSASSNTTYSTLCSFRFISTATCTKRPGVAMILEGVGGQVMQGQGHQQSLPLTLQLLAIWEGAPAHRLQSTNSHVRIFMQGCKLVFHPKEKRRCRLDRTVLFSPSPFP